MPGYKNPNLEKSAQLNSDAAELFTEGTAAGVTTGGVIGGTLGVLAGIGALAIPGLGPFIAAGPIMAGLAVVARPVVAVSQPRLPRA